MTSDATQIEPLHVLPVVIGIIAVLLMISMLISSHHRRGNIRAYRRLTLERHEKEKAFDMEYYYTRHPDRRPKRIIETQPGTEFSLKGSEEPEKGCQSRGRTGKA